METENVNLQQLTCTAILNSELSTSHLPPILQGKLKKQFDGKIFKIDELHAAIRLEKETFDQLTSSGTVHGAGDTRISVGRSSIDRFQAALDGLFRVPLPDKMRDIPVFTSLRAAYVELTGDTDVTGALDPLKSQRMRAAYGDTSFAYALGNTLYRKLVNDYREISDYGVSRLVGQNIRNAKDFRTLESIRVGYYGDIPTVDTDNEDYPDLGEVSDEKIEYALKEKGGIITINRRTIINDDVRLVQKIIDRLPRAARRTLAKRVWAPFITNAVFKGDNKAIFHDDHNNLGSAAYGIAAAEAARTAFFKQTEPESGETLGLRPATVAFHPDIRGLVINVNNFNPQAVTVENGNSMYGYFKAEGLFENPFVTDSNDWMMFGNPDECEIVELAFLNGQQEPLMLAADNPATGQMFVGGRIQYKITHDYEAEVTDYRNAYKSVVSD